MIFVQKGGSEVLNKAAMFAAPYAVSFMACFTWYWRIYAIKYLSKFYDNFNQVNILWNYVEYKQDQKKWIVFWKY